MNKINSNLHSTIVISLSYSQYGSLFENCYNSSYFLLTIFILKFLAYMLNKLFRIFYLCRKFHLITKIMLRSVSQILLLTEREA